MFQKHPCLIRPLKHMFSVFKQHYTYFHTLFHLHVFSHIFSNTCFQFLRTCTKHPTSCQYMWGHIQFYGRGGFLLINFILLRFFACRFRNTYPKYVSKKYYLSILNIDKYVSKMFQKKKKYIYIYIYVSKIVSIFL